MGYTKDAVSGFSWQTIYKVMTGLFSILKVFILARLLKPEDFGIFSLVAIALGLTENLTETGINLTIIQSKKDTKTFINTAWVIAIFRGFAIGLIMLAMGALMSRYFDNPNLFTLIAVAALIPTIKGFINPSIVTLQKNLEFFKDSLYRFFLISLEMILAVIFGFLLKSVWAFIISLICSAVVEVVISFIFFKMKPIFSYQKSIGKIIFKNARGLNIASVLHYLNENADNLIIGKLFNSYKLGIYQNSYALSHRTNYELSKSAHHGTIPVFTKIVDDKKRLNQAFKKTFLATLSVSLLASAPFFIFPALTVKILLGNQWLDAIELIRPLIIAGILQAISSITHTFFLARKSYGFVNFHLFATLLIMVYLIYYLGLQFGLMGSVLGIVIARLITLPILAFGVYKNAK